MMRSVFRGPMAGQVNRTNFGVVRLNQVQRVQKTFTTASVMNSGGSAQAASKAFDVSSAKRVVYRGGFDNVLRILKRVSLFSCVCTVVGVPLLALTSNNPRMKGVQKWVVAFVVVTFGVTTTIALHVIAKPYVGKIMIDPAGELLVIETMNMVGKTKTSAVEFSKVVRAERPWATFSSIANPKMSYFVEEAPEAYLDQAFREKLFDKVNRARGKA